MSKNQIVERCVNDFHKHCILSAFIIYRALSENKDNLCMLKQTYIIHKYGAKLKQKSKNYFKLVENIRLT